MSNKNDPAYQIAKAKTFQKITGDAIKNLHYGINKMAKDMSNNDWYEKSELPPVGCKVKTSFPEAVHDSAKQAHDKEAEIVAHSKDVAIFKYLHNNCLYYHGFYALHFHPIKSDREKAIEAAIDMLPDSCILVDLFNYETGELLDGMKENLNVFFGKYYDAGLLRLPEDK